MTPFTGLKASVTLVGEDEVPVKLVVSLGGVGAGEGPGQAVRRRAIKADASNRRMVTDFTSVGSVRSEPEKGTNGLGEREG